MSAAAAAPAASLALARAAKIRIALWRNGYRAVAVYGLGAACKTPGKQPAGDGWQTRARRDPPEACQVQPDPDTLNTGILCDGLRAIDIDIEDAAKAERVEGLALLHLGIAPVRYRDNSARRLLLYRAAVGSPRKCAIADAAKKNKVEVLGHGQQFVTDGTHPSGARIKWRAGAPLVPLQQLVAVDEGQIGRFLADAAEVIGAPPPRATAAVNLASQPGNAELAAVDPDALAAIVALIPNDAAFDDRGKFIGMAAALAAAFAPDLDRGKGLFVDWCDRWHRGAQREGEAEAVWDSVVGSEYRIGADWLIRQAVNAGIDVHPYQVACAQGQFPATEDPPPDNAPVSAEPTPPLVLSPAAPLDSARELVRRAFTHPEGRTLHHQQGGFYRWRGTHYTETAREGVIAAIYRFLDRAKQRVKNELVPFDPGKFKVANVLEALAATTQLPDTAIAPAWLDDKQRPAASEILPCANGVLHLQTRELTPATPAFFGLNAVGYPYDATAPQPAEWIKFLSSIWPDDQQSIDTLQELFGLLLTADTSQQKAFLIVGPKRSGKGTIARVLIAMLGKENVAGPTLSSLTQNFGVAPLIGKPLAVISDARLGGRADASIIAERLLAITGEDAITVDRKYREAWTGRLPTRFVILTNELPRIADASGALASRFVVLVLTRSFYGQEDATLTGRLIAELPGILLWSIEGRDRLAKRGHFIQPDSAKQAIDELEDLGSPIGAFLRDHCIVGAERSVRCETLYTAWAQWCAEQHRDHPGTAQGFSRDLRAAVPGLKTIQPRDAETGKQVREYQGIGLALADDIGAQRRAEALASAQSDFVEFCRAA